MWECVRVQEDVCVRMEWRGLERGRGVAVVVEERVGRRWKRGRPFPRAARNFHQPPQLAGSAAALPALPELTLFTLNLTGKVSLVSVKKGDY